MSLYKVCICITRNSSRIITGRIRFDKTEKFRRRMSTTNFEEIENYLNKYQGGEICISKEYWDEGIAVININNPSKRNAISGKMMVDLRNCIAKLEKWEEGKAVLLRGLGENFCSGGDLEFAKATGHPEGAFNMSTAMQDALTRLKALPLLSVSLVHGPTLGGGAEISVACDHLLASDNARFGFVHGKMGLMTAWGATTRLVQLLGERKTLELVLKGDVMTAEQMLGIGLASQVVGSGTRLEEALEFIRERTKFHHSIVRAFKISANKAGESVGAPQALELDKKLFCPFWGGELNKQALARNIKHVKKGNGT